MKKTWPDALKVHVVSHTHWDREWRLPADFFFLKLQRCVDELLDILKRDPEYRAFMLDGQMAMVEDYLRFRPERAGEIRGHVRAGRLAIGPWYTLVDNNLIDGESIVRNLLLGIRAARALGDPMLEGYLISSFGHNGQMPQIFAGFGIGSVLFSRGVSEGQVRSEFTWESPDGTRALALHLPDRYTKSNWFYLVHRPGVLGRDGLDWKYRWPDDFPAHCCDAASADNYWFRIGEEFREDEMAWAACAEALVEKALRVSAVPILLAMDGVDHLFPTRLVPRIVRAANEHFGREIFVHSTLAAYVRDVRAFLADEGIELETLVGEMRRPIQVPGFNQLLAGTVSARMPMKRMNHAAETSLLREAEPLSTMAWLAGEEYPAAFLEDAWKRLMWNHAHDGICGTSVDAVHDDMACRYARVRRTGGALAQRAMQSIAARIDTRAFADREMALAVFNPGARKRTQVVRAIIDVPFAWESRSVRILDEEGREIPCHVFGKQRQEREILAEHDAQLGFLCMRYDVEFAADDVPAFGYRTYRVTPGPWSSARSGAGDGGRVIENEHLRVEARPDGALVLLDKATGASYPGLNVFTDVGDVGDSTTFVPPMDDAEFVSTGAPCSISAVAASPLSAMLRIATAWNLPARCEPAEKPVELVETAQPFKAKRSAATVPVTIASEIVLRRGSRRLEIRTRVDNSARDHRLRVLFPSGCGGAATWAADAPFDVVERGVRLPDTRTWAEPWPETQPCATFAAVSEERRGLAVLVRGIPEAACLDDRMRTLAITLLRCTRRSIGEDYAEDGPQCLGSHVFEYAIVPFAGAWDEAGLAAEAEEFVTPLRAMLFRGGVEGTLPGTHSFLAVERGEPRDPVRFSGMKPAEDGEGCVLRLFNPASRGAQVRVAPGAWCAGIESVRLDETPLAAPPERLAGGEGIVVLPPKRIVTLRFARRAS